MTGLRMGYSDATEVVYLLIIIIHRQTGDGCLGGFPTPTHLSLSDGRFLPGHHEVNVGQIALGVAGSKEVGRIDTDEVATLSRLSQSVQKSCC